MSPLRCSLRAFRQRAGLQQQELAARVGASRQTLTAIEAGETVPSTALALALARALECRVEDLFALAGDDRGLPVIFASGFGTTPGKRVRLGFVQGNWVAHPLQGDEPSMATTPADGILGRGRPATVKPLRDAEALRANLLVAGCDPALGLLSGHLQEGAARLRLHWIEAASGASLAALTRGHVHVAGLHLYDEATGEHNLPAARARLGQRPLFLFNLAAWSLGFVVRKRRRIRRPADLAAPGVKLALREPGSGARALLDRLLAREGIPLGRISVGETVHGHHAVARSVAGGTSDVGVATAAAAAAFELEFIPLSEDRFDLVMFADTLQTPAGERLIDALSSTRFRRDIGALPGYSVARTGKVVARVST